MQKKHPIAMKTRRLAPPVRVQTGGGSAEICSGGTGGSTAAELEAARRRNWRQRGGGTGGSTAAELDAARAAELDAARAERVYNVNKYIYLSENIKKC